jgi:hypothetical protein
MSGLFFVRFQCPPPNADLGQLEAARGLSGYTSMFLIPMLQWLSALAFVHFFGESKMDQVLCFGIGFTAWVCCFVTGRYGRCLLAVALMVATRFIS